MDSYFRMRRRIAAYALAGTLVVVMAGFAMGLGYPEPVSSGALGPDWQCARIAFVFTSCTPVVKLKTAAAAEEKGSSCQRSQASRGVHDPRDDRH